MSHHDMGPILIGIVVILYNISSENISSYERQACCYKANKSLEKEWVPCLLKTKALSKIILSLILKFFDPYKRKQCSSILTHKYCNKNGISFKLELYQWCMTRIWCWKTRENFFFEKKGIFLFYYIKLSSFVVWIETKDRWRRVHFLEDMISRFFLRSWEMPNA